MSNPSSIHEVFPYLRVKDANSAIDFYRQAFGATELFRLSEPSGRIGHAELKFGEATIMVSEEYPEYGIHAPGPDGNGSAIHLHVEDVDGMTDQAVAAGASLTMAPADQFYGERVSKLRDPYGHEWMLGSSIEEVSNEEMQRRFTEMCTGKAAE
mgnify:CR=1 FL=1